MINLPKRTCEANAEGELAHSYVKSVSLYHSNPIRPELFARPGERAQRPEHQKSSLPSTD